MTETTVSASHFRVHLKEIANSVEAGEQVVAVERHGCPMFAVVSLEDFEFLRRHKYGAAAAAAPPIGGKAPEPARAEAIRLFQPDEQTSGSTGKEILVWRDNSWKPPKHLPYKFPD
jgi:prevent-host-death family protein